MGLVYRGWVPEQGHHALQQGTPRLAAGDTPRPQTGHSIYRATKFKTMEQTSHSIIMTLCPEQPDKNYLQGDISKWTLSCDLVFKLLLQRHGMAFYKEAQHLAHLFVTVPQTSASAGHLWEQQCHLVIPSLCHIDLIPMKVDENKLVLTTAKKHKQVMIDKLIPEIYTKKATFKSTINPKNYCIPLSSNNPTFDVFF